MRLLCDAAESGDVAAARKVIASGSFDLGARDEDDGFGWTALHYAAASGSVQIIELLLAEKVSPDVRDRSGRTALHAAAQVGGEKGIKSAKALVGGGALVNLEDKAGWTPYQVARFRGKEMMCDVLVSLGAETRSVM